MKILVLQKAQYHSHHGCHHCQHVPTKHAKQAPNLQSAASAVKKQSLWSRVFDTLEDIINTHIDPPISLLSTFESAMGFDSKKITRLGVIPRYAEDGNAIRWFDVPGFNIFHTVNAWDEEGDDGKNYIATIAPNLLTIEHCVARIEASHGLMEIVKIDLEKGMVTRRPPCQEIISS
ncbi:hypothetical protein Droror1_Dr00004209 [Drosera rotundifolia]